MDRKFSALIPVLMFSAFVLAAWMPSAEAQPILEIAYDDGTAEAGVVPPIGDQLAVKFSLPSGWPEAKLLVAKYYIHDQPVKFTVHVYRSDGVTELTSPFNVTPTTTGWFEVDLSAFNIIVTDDFYISIEYPTAVLNPSIGLDYSAPDGRSYYGTAGSWNPTTTEGDYMIRAVVQSVPVGGVVSQADPSVLLMPYITTSIVLVAAVVGLAVTLKKRL